MWQSRTLSRLFLCVFLIEKSFGQLAYDADHTPAIGIKGTRCYDQFNRPQRCIPEFENAAFNMPIEATNTCGEIGDQEYCVQTGVTGIRKSCEICHLGQHDARFLTDFHNVDNPTWWQSETLLESVSQVNLTLKFGKAFDITYIRIWFNSPRPESFFLSKKTTANGPWIPYQHYSATCRDTYGLPDQTFTTRGEETRALCTSEYSDISPLRGGNVAFGTLEGRPSAYNFDTSPELQEWVTATEIMITLDRINTFGDEVFGDQQVLRSYFYAIADIAVGARCKCNGHASECVESTGNRGLRIRVCRCEHNTAGPDCSECLPFYNDVPWGRASAQDSHECKACNCNGYSNRCVFDAKLYQETGHGGYCLDCDANRDGPQCEKCRPNYYMRPDGYCTECNCDETGSLHQQCDVEGKCRCKPGIVGDKCDRCAENHYEFSKSGCKNCGCSPEGSIKNTPTCNPNTGFCDCKENVEGKRCSECKPGFFNLNFDNEFGCTPCFCYGHSSKCQSAAGYSKYAIESSFAKSSERWTAENQNGDNVPIKYDGITQSIGVQADSEETIYFIAPDRFLGDRRASYNKLLEFSGKTGDSRTMPTATDIILEGSGKRVTTTIFAQDNPVPSIETQNYKFRLHEDPDFQWQPRMSSRDFISILTNLTAIKIRGTYSPAGVGFLKDIKLETASRGTAGEPALWMEHCDCPSGYIGQFCESCAPGFRHFPPHGGPFTNCIPCDCHGHADICDAETGQCICRHNTAGENCDLCARGYYGDALIGTPGDCLPCDCPNGGACIQIDDDITICTECPTGYSGHKCDICSDGYFGDPMGKFGPAMPCEICECNQNIDSNGIGNCNTTTGECLKCIYNTGGTQCEVCLPGFYGNALVLPKGDCKRCECNPIGTEADANMKLICDSTTGSCNCKPHVTGRNCDQCEEGFFNLGSGEGCQSCNCDLTGSFNHTCDLYSGQCYCRPGVTGLRCDHCEARKYGFSLDGCKHCDCDPIGSNDLQCDASGQCPCYDNVEGRRCDRCKENKYDRQRGCIDCPECYNLVQQAYGSHNQKVETLDTLLVEIERRPTVITDEAFPIELGKLQTEIDIFDNEVKDATGNNSIGRQVLDIKKRRIEVSNSLDAINENIDIIDSKSRDATRSNYNCEEVLDTLEMEVSEIASNFDLQAKKVLEEASRRNETVGLQNDKMKNISQEARKIADELDAKANTLSKTAVAAKNKSINAYEEAKKINSDQGNLREEVRKLKNDVNDADRKLNSTKTWTMDVSNEARQVKEEAVKLLNEANNLFVPEIDMFDLSKRSMGLANKAEGLKNKTDALFRKSDDMVRETDLKTNNTVELLLEADRLQDEINELLTEIYEINEEVIHIIENWNEIWNNTNIIWKDLQNFDSATQKSQEEADEALRTIPIIEGIINDIVFRTKTAGNELKEATETANMALRKAVDATQVEKSASQEVKELLAQTDDLDNQINDVTSKADDTKRRVDDSDQRVSDLLDGNRGNITLMVEAKEKVGQASKVTTDVSRKIDEILPDVQNIIDELQNSPNINDTELDNLEDEITHLEFRIDETRLDDQLTNLQEEHQNQEKKIDDYRDLIKSLRKDVENVEQIVKALPEGCFRRVELEP